MATRRAFAALYEAIERLGLRDAGTGSTFQALEARKLIKCRYHLRCWPEPGAAPGLLFRRPAV
jgi:hypothetical protein